MVEPEPPPQILQAPHVQRVGLTELMENPLVKEFAIPFFKNQLKEQFGINTKPDKELYKSRAGRFIYNIRDLWHGVWWTIPLFVGGLLMVFVLFLWMRKVLGV